MLEQVYIALIFKSENNIFWSSKKAVTQTRLLWYREPSRHAESLCEYLRDTVAWFPELQLWWQCGFWQVWRAGTPAWFTLSPWATDTLSWAERLGRASQEAAESHTIYCYRSNIWIICIQNAITNLYVWGRGMINIANFL